MLPEDHLNFKKEFFMTIFKNFSFVSGLILILYAVVVIILPPKFGNYFYGIRTKLTIRNKIVWAAGQRLFAFSIIGIGFILLFVGIFKIDEKMQPFLLVLLLISLWVLAKYIVHKILLQNFKNL